MRNRLVTTTFPLLLICCLGCSGSGAAAAIDANIRYCDQQAAFIAALLLVSASAWRCSRRLRGYPIAFLTLLILHPTWWQGTYSGDCGFGVADNSLHVGVFGVLLLVAQLLHLSPPKPRRLMVAALALAAIVPVAVIGLRPDPVLSAPESALLNAAAVGDLPTVKSLVGRGVHVDARRRSNPPTRWEPLENAWTRLRFPDYPFQQGYTPLMLACIGDHAATAEFLLDHGADANAMERDGGSTPLYFALEYEHQDLIPLLIRHGAVPESSP